MCRVPTPLIALVSIALFASQVKASCPLDTLMVEYIVFSSTDPSMQQSATLNCSSPPYGTGYGRASYDLAAGTASVAVDAHIGPTSSGPISFTAQLAAQLDIHSGASFREGDSNTGSTTGPWPGLRLIQVIVTTSADSPFVLHTNLLAFTSISGGFGYTQLSFPDLPPGYSIVSCQGFAAGAVVPARTHTWGRLKTLYR